MRELKGMESMLSRHLLIEPGGLYFTISPPTCCSGECGGQSGMIGAVEGPGYASWVVATLGFPIPSVCGPNLVRIVSDSWDFLSHLLFYETRVESKLSSSGAQ